MFKNFSIRNKILLIFIVAGIIPMVIIALIAATQSRGALTDKITNELQLYQEMVERRIEEYTEGKLEEGWSLGRTQRIIDAVEIYNNYGEDSSEWQEAYQNLDAFLPDYANKYGVLSIYILDQDGKGIYGSGEYKEAIEGADYSVRDYFQQSIKGEQNISEFEFSDIIDDYYITVATPLLGQEGDIVATVNMYIPVPTIQEIVQNDANLVGESGDVYLVNADGLLYTDTLGGRFAQNAAFKERLNTVAYENMASHIGRGNDDYAGTGLYDDYDGHPVIGAYGVLNIGNTPLGIIVEIDQEEGLADVNSLILYIIIITITTIAIAFALIFFGSGSITKPIKYLKETLNKIADKDFTVSVDYQSKDELGDVSRNLNRTIKDLRNSLISVNQSSNFVASSTDEISVGNQDLSQRTQEQASSVEEISSTIEEISSSIKQVANSSLEGEKLAGKTLEVVEEGQGAVLETKNSMENISESSEKIAAIISTVNDIAFQTNLLALNAAVEAARAGEQGRGFAVVAAEVRNLAGRTAESAKEIENLISTSVERIKVGNEKVERAASILEEIVANTENTNDVVSEIAAAMREQATATDQITSTVENLNQVTQQNASMVEEIASSSEAMSSEANNLMDMVAQFELGEEVEKKTKKVVEKRLKNKTKVNNVDEVEEDDDFDLNMDEFEKF